VLERVIGQTGAQPRAAVSQFSANDVQPRRFTRECWPCSTIVWWSLREVASPRSDSAVSQCGEQSGQGAGFFSSDGQHTDTGCGRKFAQDRVQSRPTDTETAVDSAARRARPRQRRDGHVAGDGHTVGANVSTKRVRCRSALGRGASARLGPANCATMARPAAGRAMVVRPDRRGTGERAR